jgi:peptidoglycan/xylan/chitin deacetylase (PgdA/CDA1 family)
MNNQHHRAAVALAALAGGAHAGPALCSVAPGLRAVLGVRDRVEDGDTVALTFDDGPDRTGTPAIVSSLDRLGVTATFFVTGEQVRERPTVAAEMAAAGHEIGLHGDRHRNLLRVGPRALRDDLARAHAAIVAATGRAPRLYRPPYGVLSGSALALARRNAWETVLWTRWGRDWRADATPESVAAEVSAGLRGGEILLLHDADRYAAPGAWRTTLRALPAIVDHVRGAGFGFGPVQAPFSTLPPSSEPSSP